MKSIVRIFAIIAAVLLIAGISNVSPSTAAPLPHFRVAGDAGWFATGLTFTAGESVSFTTHGQAMTGPLADYPEAHSNADGQTFICTVTEFPFEPCALEGAPYGALVGKFGASGTPFLIGSSFSGSATESGELFLAVNDNLPYYSDNFGGFIVFVGP